jgi:hypothetical protein
MIDKRNAKTQSIQHHEEFTQESLGEKLETMIKDIPSGEIPLSEILDVFGEDSLLILSVFLALVFLVPVSIPGVSTAFGFAILFVGIARLLNRRLWLPKKITNHTIAAEKLADGLCKALVWFHRLEKFSRPHRLPWVTTHASLSLLHKLAFILATGLLMVPFGFVPFSNTLPAFALICFAIGEIEKDGVTILTGHLVNLATLIYFTFLIVGGGLTIIEGLRFLPF